MSIKRDIDTAVMARLRAPFGCEFIDPTIGVGPRHGHWRIHDANDDALASVSGLEEGYAQLIVRALNEHFETPHVDKRQPCPYDWTVLIDSLTGQVGAPRSTVRRILEALQERGWLPRCK